MIMCMAYVTLLDRRDYKNQIQLNDVNVISTLEQGYMVNSVREVLSIDHIQYCIIHYSSLLLRPYKLCCVSFTTAPAPDWSQLSSSAIPTYVGLWVDRSN